MNIAKRRAKVDDQHRDKLPDAPDSDPREVLDYLQRYSGREIPGWVLQADVCDALTLNNWLWWEDRRRELHFLRAGRDRGLFLSQLGAQVGVGKQGVIDRIDRLEALLRYDRPDEKLSRTARAEYRAAQLRRSAENRWVTAHRAALHAVIGDIVELADRYGLGDDDREWIDELALDARDDNITPTTLALLNLAVAELRTAPLVIGIKGTRPQRVHAVLAHADRLRTDFAGIGVRDAGEPDRGRDPAARPDVQGLPPSAAAERRTATG